MQEHRSRRVDENGVLLMVVHHPALYFIIPWLNARILTLARFTPFA